MQTNDLLKTKSSLFFIALVPPSPVREHLQHLKERFAREYQCQVALRSPPHITLIPPFRLESASIGELIKLLSLWSQQKHTFDLRLEDYGCFSPRVIYWKVVPNDQLDLLQDSLKEACSEIDGLPAEDRPFHPHVTIATRDLGKSQFRNAWQSLKGQSFIQEWKVDELALLKHNGKTWDLFYSFGLGPDNSGIGNNQSA